MIQECDKQPACRQSVQAANFLKDAMKKGTLNRAWQQVMT